MLQYIYKIEGGIAMISYKPLLIILVKKGLNLTQLKEGIKASSATIAKIKKNEYVSVKSKMLLNISKINLLQQLFLF